MRHLFGTDGIRGVANELLTPELCCSLAQACAKTLGNHENPYVLIGRDTRRSGTMLEAATAAGFCSMGYNVHLLGVVPTPVVAWLVGHTNATAGVMISASHNPAPDNGIKFFNQQGEKLSDETEAMIEKQLELLSTNGSRMIGAGIGEIHHDQNLVNQYIQAIQKTVPVELTGMKIAVDTAYGATYQLASKIFASLGIEITVLHNMPDGMNINESCGSTHLAPLKEAVRKGDYDCGIAFDGDGDRCLAVTADGEVVDGDQMMVICLKYLPYLKDQVGIVATVMSNIGIEKALAQEGKTLLRAQVGDRYVLEAMKKQGWRLGGEQSGHVIFLEHQVTGDGILTALQLLSAIKISHQSLEELRSKLPLYPQTLLNVPVSPQSKNNWKNNPRIQETIHHFEQQLGDSGRILVRASGTEPKIRVMLEGREQNEIEHIATAIAKNIQSELG